MGGITGWIDWDKNIEENKYILENMTNTLQHRGPDSCGLWLSPNAGFGNRRLNVIDPENGSQPLIKTIGNNKYIITYNGELYNAFEIRNNLMKKGYNFKTHCDTEVALTSYIEWGEESLQYFNGIYSIGIWDTSNQTLFLARDRFGVKPLFYSKINQSFIFGSELKALLSHPYLKPIINGEGLAEIFALGPSRTSGCGIFKNINELKPAHYLIYNKNNLLIKRYWALKSLQHSDNLYTTAEKTRNLIINAVERQLVSDVTLCTFLSGGLDSSAITCIAANCFKKSNRGQLNTYSIDYIGNEKYFVPDKFQPNSDSEYINIVTQFANTNHHYTTIGIQNLSDALFDAVIAKDLPGMADIDSSLLLACKEIKHDFTVALSGECADEIFGGYPWFHDTNSLELNTFPWLRSLEYRLQLFNKEIINKMNPFEYVSQRYLDTLKEVPKLNGENPREAKMRELFYLNLTWFMATLLDRKDRMSMATSLEARVPFCDHNLVEYVWNIPWEMKIYNGMEKGIMRKSLEGILPNEVLYRKKSPYPKTHNPLYTELVKNQLSEIINDNTSPILDLINVDYVTKLINTNGEIFEKPWFGQLMKGPQLMAFLIQTNIWLKHYKVIIE